MRNVIRECLGCVLWILTGVVVHLAVFDLWSLRPRPLVKTVARTIAGAIMGRAQSRFTFTNAKGLA